MSEMKLSERTLLTRMMLCPKLIREVAAIYGPKEMGTVEGRAVFEFLVDNAEYLAAGNPTPASVSTLAEIKAWASRQKEKGSQTLEQLRAVNRARKWRDA